MLDPDLQIKGGGEGKGGGHPDPDIRGRSGLQKNFFGPSGLILVYKSGGARVPSPLSPLDPPLHRAQIFRDNWNC